MCVCALGGLSCAAGVGVHSEPPCRFVSASTEKEVPEEAVEELKPTVPEEVKLGKEEETPVKSVPEVAKPEAPEKVLGEQQMIRFYALPRLASSSVAVEVGAWEAGQQASRQASAVAMC